MNTKTYSLVSGIVFGLVCMLYLSTLLSGNTIAVGGYELPITANGTGSFQFWEPKSYRSEFPPKQIFFIE